MWAEIIIHHCNQMIIFLDTNIFYNNWYVKNANFNLLFNFVSNTQSTILISDIVEDEVNNKKKQITTETYSSLLATFEKYQKLLDKKLDVTVKEEKKNEYSFKEIITSKCDNIIFYPYDTIPNSILVNRAIRKVKPFQEQDKGFRDTLIWLSFLEHIKANYSNEEIIFINNNSYDFYNSKKDGLHEELLNDLEEYDIKNKFSIYKDLYSFVTSTIDKSLHSLNLDKLGEELIIPYEHLIEIETEYYINALSELEKIEITGRNSDLKKILASVNLINFHIVEGIEDLSILHHKILDDPNLIFLELNFNLRISEVEYYMPSTIYNDNSDNLNTKFYNVEEIAGNTKFYDFLRIDFDVSYTFNKEIKDIQGFVINRSEILR